MTDAPIQIRKPEVVRAIRELAQLTRRPITDAVADAVRAELDRTRTATKEERERKRLAVASAVERFAKAPIVGAMLTDDDLYDEDGLPK